MTSKLTTGARVVYTARNGTQYDAVITAERIFDCTISGPQIGMIASSYARLEVATD